MITGEQTITAPADVTARPAEVTAPTSGPVRQTGAQLGAAFPPRPVASSWPATRASRSAVLARVLAAPFTLDNTASQQSRRLGVLAVLSCLATHPGESWHQRWQASGAEDSPTGETRSRPRPPDGGGRRRRRGRSWHTWARGCWC